MSIVTRNRCLWRRALGGNERRVLACRNRMVTIELGSNVSRDCRAIVATSVTAKGAVGGEGEGMVGGGLVLCEYHGGGGSCTTVGISPRHLSPSRVMSPNRAPQPLRRILAHVGMVNDTLRVLCPFSRPPRLMRRLPEVPWLQTTHRHVTTSGPTARDGSKPTAREHASIGSLGSSSRQIALRNIFFPGSQLLQHLRRRLVILHATCIMPALV